MPARESRRAIPSVDKLLGHAAVKPLLERYPRRLVVEIIRDQLDNLRRELAAGSAPKLDPAGLAAELAQRVATEAAPSLVRAVNGTGVVLHTSLGRAPLSAAARTAVAEAIEHYCTLAVNRATGKRGERYAHVERLLRLLTGAEAALVVNNNAAATLLILNTLAAGRDAVVSRGQLIEIGGAFRLPDIMTRSGARMVEVGTTNRTHLRDYRAALTPETGLLLRVHQSNYKIIGFTTDVPLEELVALGREHGVPVVDDLGSGALVDLTRWGLPREPTVPESIAAGADVVCFSGDKLLGGPQCGVIVGRRALIERMKQNQLTRALRAGKLTYAALAATLRLFLDEGNLLAHHATLALLARPVAEIERAARAVARALTPRIGAACRLAVIEGSSEVGSGSLATELLPTRLLALQPARMTADELARRLRLQTPAVFGRIEADRLLLDFRTIRPDEHRLVIDALDAVLGAPRP